TREHDGKGGDQDCARPPKGPTIERRNGHVHNRSDARVVNSLNCELATLGRPPGLAAHLPVIQEALDPDDPEVAEMLDDDPTRRGDLIKLLDSFPYGEDAPGRTSAERLRSALGPE